MTRLEEEGQVGAEALEDRVSERLRVRLDPVLERLPGGRKHGRPAGVCAHPARRVKPCCDMGLLCIASIHTAQQHLRRI